MTGGVVRKKKKKSAIDAIIKIEQGYLMVFAEDGCHFHPPKYDFIKRSWKRTIPIEYLKLPYSKI